MEQKGAFTLYWGSGSPYAWPVQLALEEKGLKYEGKLLSFSDGDTRKPEYLSMLHSNFLWNAKSMTNANMSVDIRN